MLCIDSEVGKDASLRQIQKENDRDMQMTCDPERDSKRQRHRDKQMKTDM